MRGERETINLEELLGSSQRTLTAVAHELKAPLSLMRMYAAQLEKNTLTEAERKKYNTRLLFTAEQMLQLTTGLLEGQHWKSGQLPLEPINTGVICEEVLHELMPAAKELNQKLNYQKSMRPGVAVGHAGLLKNIMFNIVFNALKHTPAGSNITLSATRAGGSARISVVDNGPGFDQRLINHVNKSANSRYQGTTHHAGSGLGLAVAKQLAATMNGSLQLKSSAKGGYCLILLPASRQLLLAL